MVGFLAFAKFLEKREIEIEMRRDETRTLESDTHFLRMTQLLVITKTQDTMVKNLTMFTRNQSIKDRGKDGAGVSERLA